MSNADPASDIRSATGAHTRLVWSQDQTNDDEAAHNSSDYLYGFDTDDGRGERKILQEVSSYHRPLLTSDGKRVIYTDYAQKKLYAVDFSGANKRLIGTNLVASCIRAIGGTEWVYARVMHYKPPVDTVYRFDLDNPTRKELVWAKTRIDMDGPSQTWFMVSGDGTRAYGTFPWGKGGMAYLPNQRLDTSGRYVDTLGLKYSPGMGGGCWPSFAPDNSYRWFILQGGHSRIIMGNEYGPRTRYSRTYNGRFSPIEVKFTGIPEMSKYAGVNHWDATYWPRFTNNVRFLTLGYPQAVKADCEIYLGQFGPNLDTIVRWVKVTANTHGDYFPDCWIDPAIGGQVPAPVISPEVGNFVRTLSVSMSCPLEGAEIRYTINGTEPTAGSTKYSAAISISATTTFKAAAFKAGLLSSLVTTKTYAKVEGFSFASLAIAPESTSVFQGGTATFSAQALDQFGKSLSPQPPLSWTTTGSGNVISSSGVFTAGQTTGTCDVFVTATWEGQTRSAKARIRINAAVLQLTLPIGGERFGAGDTITVKWTADTIKVQGVIVSLSVDNGKSFESLHADNAIVPKDPRWRDFRWKVPLALTSESGVSLSSSTCFIRISDYFNENEIQDRCDKPFSIGTTATQYGLVSARQSGLDARYGNGAPLTIMNGSATVSRLAARGVPGTKLTITGIQGRTIVVVQSNTSILGELNHFAPGTYIVRLSR